MPVCWLFGHKTLITNAAKSKFESRFAAQTAIGHKSEQPLQLEQLLDILVMRMRAAQFRLRLY